MPTSYLAPGVYVEEVSTGARPIEAVGTSTAALIGVAPNPDARLNEAVAVNNWTEFLTVFSGPDVTAGTPLAQAVYGFFDNGGTRVYVVNVGANKPITGDAKTRSGVQLLEANDEVAIVAAPGFTDAVSYQVLISHCTAMKDRIAILDVPPTVPAIASLTNVATAAPTKGKGAASAETADTDGGAAAGVRPPQSDNGYAATYFPWITVRDVYSGELIDVPPSGHLAGIYARTDATRGVFKAPANEAIRGAVNVTYRLTADEVGVLNPAGVNSIRLFPNEGVRVWGARTLAPSASEWRYVPVRRLFMMIEKSIARSTRWVVFEPNDMALWKAIRRDVTAFLTLLWRQGALMGATPQEAFFVKCDAETNPQDVIDAGQVVIVIGIAPVKPAEFVIFRIGQSVGGTQISAAGTAKGT